MAWIGILFKLHFIFPKRGGSGWGINVFSLFSFSLTRTQHASGHISRVHLALPGPLHGIEKAASSEGAVPECPLCELGEASPFSKWTLPFSGVSLLGAEPGLDLRPRSSALLDCFVQCTTCATVRGGWYIYYIPRTESMCLSYKFTCCISYLWLP